MKTITGIKYIFTVLFCFTCLSCFPEENNERKSKFARVKFYIFLKVKKIIVKTKTYLQPFYFLPSTRWIALPKILHTYEQNGNKVKLSLFSVCTG